MTQATLAPILDPAFSGLSRFPVALWGRMDSSHCVAYYLLYFLVTLAGVNETKERVLSRALYARMRRGIPRLVSSSFIGSFTDSVEGRRDKFIRWSMLMPQKRVLASLD